ncbi:hypothetical protein H0H87_007530 [Tephrocybe sp. NHM501043]|nr:hypothetical protein H0H87_007530 [Tephrocybe sp. NHM501043]
MKLSAAFGSILYGIFFAIQNALLSTLQAIFKSPSVLLSPTSLSRLFMSKLWVTFGPGLDTNCRSEKEQLITPNAYGIVLDIGAGHGHTASYLDKARVTQYIALEPNVFMHSQLRETANRCGFHESDGTLLILACGAEDPVSILSSLTQPLQGVDTLISIFTLCSVPSPQNTLTALITDVLRSGGQFLFFEHVLSRNPDAASWQRFWAPIWSFFFDGCKIDRPTNIWIESVMDGQEGSIWAEQAIWGILGESEDSLFCHRIGRMIKQVIG